VKTALFVDDEPHVLSGLRRMLRSLRNEWSVETAGSGRAALALLDAEAFDIVVSDMKMPGMDGAELLTHVRSLHPASIRVILSGEAERGAILKSIAPSHQYLSKPCEAQALRATLDRVHELGALLDREALRRVACSVEFLPVSPATHRDLAEALAQPAPSLSQIGRILERDAGSSANLLKLCNSAYFGVREPTGNVQRAVTYLGPVTLRDLLDAGAFPEGDTGIGVEDVPTCASVAQLAGTIAGALGLGPAAEDEARCAGLLHRLGQLVVRSAAPEHVAEFEPAEAQLGAYLLGLWGVPRTIVDAVAYQARPAEAQQAGVSVLTAVHAARALLDPRSSATLDLGYLRGLDLESRCAEWRAWAERQESAVGRA
jgi:HD-like signal output (HDOD) protein